MQIKIRNKYSLNPFKFTGAIIISLIGLFELYLFISYIKIVMTNI